jgi:hypothetical protein
MNTQGDYQMSEQKSTLPALYKLTEDFHKLMELEDDEDVVNALIEVVAGEIEQKAESVCKFVKILEGTAAQFKAEEQRISARRKALENRAEQVRDYIKQSLLNANIDKITAGTFRLSVGLSPGSIVIDDLQQIPAQFLTIIPEQYVPDKAAIKAAIKLNPSSVPGAHIEAGYTLRIS